ncbi:Maf family protein [Niabella insulamsoli]|uniref:Maf family protein n=1 Tax=Niabella insulamsoli TaxID=3144874 RepID=UPI0031FD22DE
MTNSVVLASSSPRRKQLLEWAEIPFEIVVEPVEETFPPDLEPADAAQHIALKKAKAVQPLLPAEKIIIAADTMVVLDRTIIGKPKDKNDAVEILMNLQGRVHQVITGVAILKGDQQILFADITEVTFNPLTKEALVFYVEKYKPYDKAGAYAIQEWIGVVGIKKINGDFYNVMGLPVSRLVAALKNI